jgi:hypothetical protein
MCDSRGSWETAKAHNATKGISQLPAHEREHPTENVEAKQLKRKKKAQNGGTDYWY